MLLKILILTIIISYVYDISGFVSEMKLKLSKWLCGISSDKWEFRPFTCSKCCTFWAIIIMGIVLHQFSLTTVLLACLFSFIEPIITDILITIRDLVEWILDKIQRRLG